MSPDRLRIVDPGPRLLHTWQRCTSNTGMSHLRSPAVHHLDLDPFSLLRFASDREADAQTLVTEKKVVLHEERPEQGGRLRLLGAALIVAVTVFDLIDNAADRSFFATLPTATAVLAVAVALLLSYRHTSSADKLVKEGMFMAAQKLNITYRGRQLRSELMSYQRLM